jgi:hypothetical protein
VLVLNLFVSLLLQVDVGATLGICFRLLLSRGTHSVLSTAGATVRQGVAVVFERLEAQCQQLDSALPDDSSLRPESTATGKHLLEDLCDLASGQSASHMACAADVSHIHATVHGQMTEAFCAGCCRWECQVAKSVAPGARLCARLA